MFVFLIYSVISLRPIVLIPGLYGSNLKATYDNFAKHWYCPKKMENDLFWVAYKFAIPPVYNCLFEMLQGHYDGDTNMVTSQPGIKVEAVDFGGSEGISSADTGIFGWHIFEVFGPLLEYFKKKGYTIKKNIFGAPYDWRLAMVGIEHDFYPKLKELIERSYNINGEPAVIMGYSCGGFAIQRFLSKFVNEEWKSKYIHKVILLAPAFAGSSDTIDVLWNQYFPVLPFLKSDSLKAAIQNVPAVTALFPNHEIYGDIPLIYGPNDEKIIASQVPQFFIDHKKVTGNSINMMLKNVEISKEAPKSLGVPIYLLYNSGIETIFELKFQNYDEKPSITYQPGDGAVPSRGPLYACEKWGSVKNPVVCHDLNQKDDDFNHGGLGTNPYVMDLIYKASQDLINEEDWINVKGTTFIESPLVNIINQTYIIKNNLRSERRFTKIIPENI